MATVRLWSDADVQRDARVKAVFEDIRATRQSDFVNNFWRALANQPDVLERTWKSLKSIMAPGGAVDPVVKGMIYIAVSTANGCSYCVHSHTAAARAKGMTDAQHGELLSIIGMASETNALVTSMQIETDPAFLVR
jgi:AhpD family alkylhydroperoxidase